MLAVVVELAPREVRLEQPGDLGRAPTAPSDRACTCEQQGGE
jgi:hypothetical protein